MSFSKVFLVLFIIAALASAVSYAPRFLAFSNHPNKSDAIVLLIGPDYKARHKEAHRQIKEGLAEYLLVPAHKTILKADRDGELRALNDKSSAKKTFPTYAHLYENTHLEILWAKHMMAECNFRSVIFLSSPHHLRRVKIIADRVFDDSAYSLLFVPTNYEKSNEFLWWANSDNLKQVLSEYVKIVWFLLYTNLPFLQG